MEIKVVSSYYIVRIPEFDWEDWEQPFSTLEEAEDYFNKHIQNPNPVSAISIIKITEEVITSFCKSKNGK